MRGTLAESRFHRCALAAKLIGVDALASLTIQACILAWRRLWRCWWWRRGCWLPLAAKPVVDATARTHTRLAAGALGIVARVACKRVGGPTARAGSVPVGAAQFIHAVPISLFTYYMPLNPCTIQSIKPFACEMGLK